jgi:hypothetical protein
MSSSRIFVFFYTAFLCVSSMLHAEPLQTLGSVPTVQTSQTGVQWSATDVQHIYGLPDIKPHKKGTLTLTAEDLKFTAKSGSTAIPRSSITAISVGDERVEIFGITGRIMRMAIPDNGGLAIASFAHHRIDMLTVEFSDVRGGAHSAVFFLGAKMAAQAIEAFALQPKSPQPSVAFNCQNALTEPGSMLVLAPDWNGVQVPAVYQGLVYEHIVERFRNAKSLTRVYREGESRPTGLCPQYTVHLTVTGFKLGSSVKRAMLGPVGMFVGTTQMAFAAELSDRTGNVNIREQIKATIRDESESTNVADKVAKTLEKKYEKTLKASEKTAHTTSGAPKL